MYSEEGLVGEYDAVGTEIRTYGWKPGSIWSTDPLFLKQGAKYYYYHNDHLGTAQKMTSANGAVVWSATYSSFGEASVDGASTVTNNLRFPGQYWDEETGLHYDFHRYYDPEGGRYLRTDPIGFLGGDENLYVYVMNNPANWMDPNGLDVLNNSKGNVYVLGGGANEPAGRKDEGNIRVIEPGEKYIGGQDAIISTTGPNAGRVFKTTDFIDATVNQDGSISTSSSEDAPFYATLGQWVKGGYLEQEDINAWKKALELQKAATGEKQAVICEPK